MQKPSQKKAQAADPFVLKVISRTPKGVREKTCGSYLKA
jgi:hypothetical protein